MNSLTHIAAVSFLAFAMTATVAAQEKPVKEKQEAARVQQEKDSDATPTFVDEDGDGINDNTQGPHNAENTQRQARQRRRDHFIDRDGDGINDERCDGVGVGGGQRRGQQKGGGGR